MRLRLICKRTGAGVTAMGEERLGLLPRVLRRVFEHVSAPCPRGTTAYQVAIACHHQIVNPVMKHTGSVLCSTTAVLLAWLVPVVCTATRSLC